MEGFLPEFYTHGRFKKYSISEKQILVLFSNKISGLAKQYSFLKSWIPPYINKKLKQTLVEAAQNNKKPYKMFANRIVKHKFTTNAKKNSFYVKQFSFFLTL